MIVPAAMLIVSVIILRTHPSCLFSPHARPAWLWGDGFALHLMLSIFVRPTIILARRALNCRCDHYIPDAD